MASGILLYGAYGYTGKLIAKEAQQQGTPLLLAGRREAPLQALAAETGHAYRVADLADFAANPALLSGITVVLHVAGPYSETAAPMVEACLEAGVHYLDITGEWGVFEQIAALDLRAKAANVMLLPGTGFDVVPSDCLALFLQQQLPSATHLELAIKPDGGVSHGTAVTGIVSAGAGSRSRINGELVKERVAAHERKIPFSGGEGTGVSIPWGDIVTAWHSTGISNVIVYMVQAPGMIRQMKIMGRLSWLLGWGPVNRFLRKQAGKHLSGPGEATLSNNRSEVWGEVRDERGNRVAARINGPQVYRLTALTALHIARQVLSGNWKPGFQTPSGAYGADLILEACDATREILA
ncbi:MAG: saccharopine dehydrogenase NADP-binding domain-containing protein [Bacteroidia bacterium]|nr:saccharopine dehydrogenase NADP-binding domain-containing protein [Bacteroidia bacterium]